MPAKRQKKNISCSQKRFFRNLFAGTLAPAREIPSDGSDASSSGEGGSAFERSLMYFLTNVNLVVPCVAAVAVIVIAVAVICVLRGGNNARVMKPGE